MGIVCVYGFLIQANSFHPDFLYSTATIGSFLDCKVGNAKILLDAQHGNYRGVHTSCFPARILFTCNGINA